MRNHFQASLRGHDELVCGSPVSDNRDTCRVDKVHARNVLSGGELLTVDISLNDHLFSSFPRFLSQTSPRFSIDVGRRGCDVVAFTMHQKQRASADSYYRGPPNDCG
jgi:hypothetical protein